jgi:hypothetical protein
MRPVSVVKTYTEPSLWPEATKRPSADYDLKLAHASRKQQQSGSYQVNAGAEVPLCFVVPDLSSIGGKVPNIDMARLCDSSEVLTI